MSEELLDQDHQSAELQPKVAEKVVSIRKAEANRRNALKSTGPRTPRGKRNSRRNAIRHGLFARHRTGFAALGENSEEYEKLHGDLFDDYQPVGRAEELEVELITLCWWKRKRALRYENAENHRSLRRFGYEELERQKECRQTLDKEEEMMIRELQAAKDQIETTGEVPQDLKEKLFAIRPQFEGLWQVLEKNAQELLRSAPFAKELGEISEEEYPSFLALATVTRAIVFIKELASGGTREATEAVLAQCVIPNRNALDALLRYQSGIERDLGRAVDRLERLQRRRKGEPVLPPVNVQLTR